MPSKVKIEIRAELRDKDGKLIKRYPWVRANSLLKQFIQLLTVLVSQANQTVTDILGAGNVVTPQSYTLNLAAANAEATYGVVIGSGTTPVTMTDIKLETKVTTNVAHAIVTFAVENPDVSTWRIAIARVLTNNTGGTLGIKEVGLYTRELGNNWFFCIDRTLYSVDVPNGVAVTFTYRITVSL